jgi:hypothetical protein
MGLFGKKLRRYALSKIINMAAGNVPGDLEKLEIDESRKPVK